MKLDLKEEISIRERLDGLRSPINYTYCEEITYDKEIKVIVKLSFPRFYFGNNVYLVKSLRIFY